MRSRTSYRTSLVTFYPASADRLGDGLAARLGIGIAAEIAGAQRPLREYARDGIDNRVGRLAFAEVIEHHRARPDLSDRIGNPLTGNIGRRAVHRLEQRGKLAFRVDVAGRRNADRAGAGGTKVRENVAEEVRGNDDVEPIRMQHEVRGENVDVILVPTDARI